MGEEVNGKYLNLCRVEEESEYVLSDNGICAREKLWVSRVV